MRYLLTVILLASVSLAAAAENVVVVENGRSRACIVTGASPSAAATGAAAELAAYLQKISGVAVPVAASAPAETPVQILVGQNASRDQAQRLGLKIPTGQTYHFDEEGYVVYAGGNSILLAGNETDPYEGTWFAVYDLLEKLGCRWYFPGAFGEVLPGLKSVSVPAQSRLVKPDLRVRDTWYSGHLALQGNQSNEFQSWKRRNRMCRTGFWLNGLVEGAKYLQNPVDDSTWRLLPKEKYWESHPEYYALMAGGNRNPRFLCMSNPQALEAAVNEVEQYFADHPDYHAFAFSPPDEAVLCHCADCTRALNGRFGGEGWGDISDPYFTFVFRLADKVRERRPDRWITTMAYYNRCRPPQGVTAEHPNVLLQLASIQQCNLHSYAQDGCWTRRQFGEMLRQWGELTEGQVFYEYDPHDWSHLQRPFWRSQSQAEDFRLLKRVGGWGFSDEGQMAWMSSGLNYWVRARLAWNVNDDPAAMVKDFSQRFFGPAAAPMQRFYTGIENAMRETKAHSGGFPGRDDLQVILPRPLLDQCESWLNEAARLGAAEPYKGRVSSFRIYFDRVNAYVRCREAMATADFAGAAKQGDAMVEAVKRMNDTALLQDAGPWGGSRSGATVAQAARGLAPWTDGTKGKLVAALPQVARFRADPDQDGVVGRWYLDPMKADWRDLAMTSNWESQGVLTQRGRCYSGLGWYGVDVKLAQAPEVARLLMPELTGSVVWLWCNGQYAGMTTKEQDSPLSVNLSGLLKPGANRFVLRVQGEGGLTLPPFIFVPADAADFPDKRVELPVFPAQWLFRIDPKLVGEQEGWQKVELDQSAWQPIAVPAAWEKTPVGEYDGVAWYRVRFTIPETAKDKRLVLQFGAVDEEAWVYLNGELQGENTEKSTGQTVHQIWDKPFTIKLTDARVGAENVLAVKVRDSLGAGGIWMPVRLYMIP